MAITIHLSISNLNVNLLNAPIKKHKVAEWRRKQNPYICCPTRDSLGFERQTQTESKRMKKDISCRWKWKKKAGIAILIRSVGKSPAIVNIMRMVCTTLM